VIDVNAAVKIVEINSGFFLQIIGFIHFLSKNAIENLYRKSLFVVFLNIKGDISRGRVGIRLNDPVIGICNRAWS